jgi:hypothetical protein
MYRNVFVCRYDGMFFQGAHGMQPVNSKLTHVSRENISCRPLSRCWHEGVSAVRILAALAMPQGMHRFQDWFILIITYLSYSFLFFISNSNDPYLALQLIPAIDGSSCWLQKNVSFEVNKPTSCHRKDQRLFPSGSWSLCSSRATSTELYLL